MLILAPASLSEQQAMLRWAVKEYDGPVAIRYPRGGEGSWKGSEWNGLEASRVVRHRSGDDVTILTYGSMLSNVLEASDILATQGIEATVLRTMDLSDPSSREVASLLSGKKVLVIVEEVCTGSGIRESLAWELRDTCPECRVIGLDLGPDFVTHGNQKILHESLGLDGASIAEAVKGVLDP